MTISASRSLRISSTSTRGAHDDRAAALVIGGEDAAAAEDHGRRSGSPGPGTIWHSSSIVISGLSRWARHASMTSPRLCGGMLVAMPTAMPPAPLTSRFGNLAGRTDGLLQRAVVVLPEVDRVLVEVVEQRSARPWPAGTRCNARRPADRRRPSRSCPGRRSAARSSRSPAPCAPARRRSRGCRAGGICPSPRRRRGRTSCISCSSRAPARCMREQDAAVHRLQAVAHVGQRAADDDAHRVFEIGALHLVGDRDGPDVGWLFAAGRLRRRLLSATISIFHARNGRGLPEWRHATIFLISCGGH